MPNNNINNTTDPRGAGTSGLMGMRGLNYSAKQALNELGNIKINSAFNESPVLSWTDDNDEFGRSRLDKRVRSRQDIDNIQNFRGEEQSGFWQVANGITKGGILAGTTFLQGTLGLVNGVGAMIKDWDASKFWDNDFNRTLKAVNDWSEKALPNYYTDDERDNPLTGRNIFSWNSLGDKLIKNLGFTVGAFYSGGVWSKPLSAISAIKATGALPHIASGLGATLSAVNEGSIEALNNSTDWYNLQKAQLDDAFAKEISNIEPYSDTDSYDILKSNIENNYNLALENLEERRKKMGNADLLMNLPILMASNLVEFGKLYARGFDTARKASGKIVRDEAGQYLTREATRLGRIGAGVKAATAEGLEEVMQQAASNISGELQMPAREYGLSMYEASINPDAEEETIDAIKAIATGLNKTLNDDSTWEQFIIGALTGALGMPTFGRANNANAYLGKNKVIGLSGGAVGAIGDYNQQIETDNEIVDALNNRVQSPEFRNYYQGMLRHQYFQDSMDAAAAEGKTKEFKDAEYAQMVSDVALFSKAGKLDDYVALINEAADTSDENLESIIRNTTKEDGTGPFIDSNGNPLTFTEEGKEQMKIGIAMRKQEMLKAVNDYKDINESLVARFGDALTQDQREELIWLDMLSRNQMGRASEIANQSKSLIDNLIKVYQSQADGISIQESYHGQPLSSKDAERLEQIQNNINYLNKLKELDNSSLAVNIAKNNGLLFNLAQQNAERISDSNIQQTKDQIDNLLDIPKLVNDAERYSKKLNEYLNNPQKLEQDQQKETKKAEEQIKSKEEKKQTRQLNNSKDFDDVRKTLTESQGPNRETVEKSIKESTNPVVQEYKELRDKVNSVRERMSKNGSDAQAREDANILLDKLISTAQSGTDLDTSSEIFIDSDNLPDIDGETPDQKQIRLEKAVRLIDDSLADISANPPLNPTVGIDEEGNTVETYGDNLLPGFDDDLGPVNQNTNQQVIDNGSIIVNNLGDGSISYSVNPSSFESVSDNSQAQKSEMQLADKEERPEKATKSNPSDKWHPAVAQYDFAGMDNGIFRENPNEEWKRVNGYITRGDGYNFVNDGRLAKYVNNGGMLYFGIDSTFDGNSDTIFIYVKEGDSYRPVGSMFVGMAGNYIGMEDFNKSIHDEYNSLETKPDGVWISSKLGKVNLEDIKRGRVAWGDAHNVSDALAGSEITSPNIVVLTESGVVGGSDNTVATPINSSNKVGQAYIEVPNSRRTFRGGKSLVAVNPIAVNSDVFAMDNPIINSINSAVNNLARAFKDNNTQAISDNLLILGENLLIQNVHMYTNGGKLYISQFVTDRDGNRIKVERNGKYVDKDIVKRDILLTDNDVDIIARAIREGLTSIGSHIRINKDRLSPEYSRQLIDNNLVQTYATTLKSEAAWFEFSPYVESSEQKVEDIKKEGPAINPEEARKESLSKKASIFNMGRQGSAVKAKPSEKKSSQPVVKPEQSARDAVKALLTDANRFTLLNKGFSDSWINSPDRTVEEIQNALGC